MKCPECVKQGLTSRVYIESGTTTCLGWSPYYDENGRYHSHDPNMTTTGYRCSNGHVFSQRAGSRCSNCDWNKPVNREASKWLR